jgi:hypothetical protein
MQHKLAGEIVRFIHSLVLCLSPRLATDKFSIPTDDFNDRRLLAKSLAALEEHGNYSKSLLEEAKTRVSAQRQRSILAMWRNVTRHCNTVRCANANRAKRNGKRLTLSIAIRSWRSGVRNSQNERELNLLIESKWEQWGLCRLRIE